MTFGMERHEERGAKGGEIEALLYVAGYCSSLGLRMHQTAMDAEVLHFGP